MKIPIVLIADGDAVVTESDFAALEGPRHRFTLCSGIDAAASGVLSERGRGGIPGSGARFHRRSRPSPPVGPEPSERTVTTRETQ